MSKQRIEDYIKIMNEFASSELIVKEQKPGGYGQFNIGSVLVPSKEGNKFIVELSYRQRDYKTYIALRREYMAYKDSLVEEFHNNFYEEMLLIFVCTKSTEFSNRVTTYSFADLISKGLPDNEKI